MNRITQLLKNKPKNILSVYFTAGYPKLNDTAEVITELQQQGIDLIEVGIPFSDPMADGVVIQNSGTQALQNGMSLNVLFKQLADIRKSVHIPLIMMSYLNPIMQYGFERFCADCKTTGIDGIIIPDLPFKDYIDDYKTIADKHELCIVMLITPETSDERIRLIDQHTSGFIYMVSSAATTGVQSSFDDGKKAYFERIQNMNLNNPRLIGFGISNKSTLQLVQANASGAIIGSKFVKLLASEPSIKEAVSQLLTDLKKD